MKSKAVRALMSLILCLTWVPSYSIQMDTTYNRVDEIIIWGSRFHSSGWASNSWAGYGRADYYGITAYVDSGGGTLVGQVNSSTVVAKLAKELCTATYAAYPLNEIRSTGTVIERTAAAQSAFDMTYQRLNVPFWKSAWDHVIGNKLKVKFTFADGGYQYFEVGPSTMSQNLKAYGLVSPPPRNATGPCSNLV